MFKSDCGVEGWIQEKDYFEFNLKKGDVGLCPGDDTPIQGTYEYKERQEIKSDVLKTGNYVWSAGIETYSDETIHAEVFHLFQIHDNRRGGRPPVAIRVDKGQILIITSYNESLPVGAYTGNLHIDSKIEIKNDCVIVEFVFDGQPYSKKIEGEIFVAGGGPYIKFGAYRWNAICDVKQIYKNLKCECIDVS